MGYIHSDNIKVFPTTQRSNKDASARMMTEFNLTSIINRLVDKKCFVISGDQLDNDGYFAIDNGRFEFNIFGYYFSILSITELLKAIIISTDNSLYDIMQQKQHLDTEPSAILFKAEDIDSSRLHIVAKIQITGNTDTINNMSWQRLAGTDIENSDTGNLEYTGIQFALEPSENFTKNSYYTSGDTKTFSILELIDRPYDGPSVSGEAITTKYNLRIPANSKVKFATSSLNQSIRIDDGRLD